MILRNRTILLISSEAWGDIYISKHNYAIALAQRDNLVFFLNPVNPELRKGEIQSVVSSVNRNIYIVSYNVSFPWGLKFHAKWLFNILIKREVGKVLKFLNKKIDIVWDFNCSFLYDDLKIFKADISIFQPVDKISDEVSEKRADLFVTISDNLMHQYKNKSVPRLKVAHGLSSVFISIASELPVLKESKKVKNACYIGSLTVPTIDRKVFLRIVESSPDVTFHLIGPYEKKGNNVGPYELDDDTKEFINVLRDKTNVTFYGIMNQKQIAELLPQFDLFLICYKKTMYFHNDNSHKVLEYLASGKVVVSTYLSTYEGSELLIMESNEDNNKLPDTFRQVVNSIDDYNTIDLQLKRKKFAMKNSYEEQVQKIEKKLSSLTK